MRVEHIAFLVDDPNAVSKWYCENLDMRQVRQGPGPNFMTFLGDEGDNVMFEIYHNPDVVTPDYFAQDPMVLHLAFYSDDVDGERAKLIAAGATAVGDVFHREDGDVLAMLRDPWGLAVQVLSRKERML
jgi:catechol 2,3-dioxygenase-like lactoylglutathione lyase family enzyme